MPWDIPQKKVIRINPDFTGETIWQQDQQATIKIIASRHDVHDQDLADAISRCLNIDGVNELAADMDANNHKIINLADGSLPGDAVNWGQLDQQSTDLTDYVDQEVADINIISMVWDPGIDTLKLVKGDASEVVEEINEFAEMKAVAIKSNGPITHKSEAFPPGAVVTLATLSSSRWTFVNNQASTFNFTPPSGADPYLGENYEVEGSVLITNGASAGIITIQLGGVNVSAGDILGSNPVTNNARYLLSYVIHRSAGNVYNALFIWSAV